MENVIAIGAGLTLRAVIAVLTDDDHKLTSTLIGIWEGIILSHFLHKNPRNSYDTFLALATRFAIDFLFKNSLVRLALTSVWTVVGLLLADLAPTVWRDTGLRYVYRALKRDVRAMRRSVPRWRIRNDIQVPNISLSNPVFALFSPPSTIPSSTHVVPPASPALIRRRNPPLGTLFTQVTPSVTNSLTREVLPGPSPALIPTTYDLAPFNQDPRTSLISNSSSSDPSRHDPILILDDDGVDITVPSHPQEQEQPQDPDPELSALEISPPVATVEASTAGLQLISPAPRTHINALPSISDFDLSIHTTQSHSRVDSVGKWRGNLRAHSKKVGSDLGPDFGKPYLTNAAGVGLGQNHSASLVNRLSSTGHQRSVSSPTHREIHHPQRSSIPKAQSGSGDARASSALGLTTSLAPSEIPTTTTLSPKRPAPAHQTRLSTPASHTNPDTAGPHSETRTTLPSSTPKPKSDRTSPDSTSVQNRTPGANPTADFDPAKDPIRPMPGLGSPSTVQDSLFERDRVPSVPLMEAFDDWEIPDMGDPPPPFKEFESPVNDRGEGFDAGGGKVDGKGSADEGGGECPRGKGDEGVEGKGQEGSVEGEEAQHMVTGENVGEADGMGNQEADDGTQGAGEHTQNASKNTPKQVEGAKEAAGDNEEQEQREQEEGAGDRGAGDDDQGDAQDSNAPGESARLPEAPAADASLEPTPTVLTPEQKQAEVHRASFLLKEVARLEVSLKGADIRFRGDIQARLNKVNKRIARKNFADIPNPPPISELATGGIVASEITDLLTPMIIDLLIDRQDVGPITIIMEHAYSKRRIKVEQVLKPFFEENNLTMTSSSTKCATVMTL